jgi:hypothetical protein
VDYNFSLLLLAQTEAFDRSYVIIPDAFPTEQFLIDNNMRVVEQLWFQANPFFETCTLCLSSSSSGMSSAGVAFIVVAGMIISGIVFMGAVRVKRSREKLLETPQLLIPVLTEGVTGSACEEGSIHSLEMGQSASV